MLKLNINFINFRNMKVCVVTMLLTGKTFVYLYDACIHNSL